MASSSGNAAVAPAMLGVEDVVYVAVGNDINECKLNLVYAIKHSGGKRICILHVHEPAKMIPICKLADKFQYVHLILLNRLISIALGWEKLSNYFWLLISFFFILTKIFDFYF